MPAPRSAMRYLFPLFLVLSCLLAFLPGCEPKEDLVQTTGSLEFAADTVLFDTVFTTIRTVTKRLWVYNRNRGAVKTDVRLKGTAGPTYSLIVNGDAGPAASGVTIRGRDSLLVLVRATLGDNGTAAKPFLITDELHFLTNGNDQDVKLVAYGQNAYFHRGEVLPCNAVWRNDKPHVIFNSVQVNPGCVLRILPGTRVYSHAGSAIIVQGTLLVNTPADYQPGAGSADTVKANNPNIVRFQGDRLETGYSDIPGQWGGLVFTETSTGNRIRYAEIKNATFGALLYNPVGAPIHPDLVVSNTIIRNISGSKVSFANASASTGGGIISYSGDVSATNCLFTNCGEYAVVGIGGTYDLNFCTVANYTPAFRRETASLAFTNVDDNRPAVKLPTSVSIRNSIVWGSFEDELLVNNYADYLTPTSIRNNVVRTKEYATTAAVVGAPGVNLLNMDPLFVHSAVAFGPGAINYRLQDASPATAPRRAAAGTTVPPRDLQNLPRINPSQPSLGAYEHKQ